MNLEERIINILNNNLEGSREININSKLVGDLMMDSFDILMIVSALEDEFGINIAEEDFADIKTVKDIIDKFKKSL